MILGVDLGTTTGLACAGKGGILDIHSIPLATPKEVRAWSKAGLLRARDPRVERLCKYLMDRYFVTDVVFEDVVFASSTYQVQLWASLRGALWLAFSHAKFHPVPVGTLKKFATGNGCADKEAMVKAAKKDSLDVQGLDDNAIDAYWLAKWGMRNII
jgi:Holliday junction resolvasome RuvABC endonuclease subunit